MTVNLLHQIIDRAAERDPTSQAFRFMDQSLTYAALADRSARLAAVLIGQGVKRGDRVGILMPMSLESALAIYGILKSGAAYVPLDPSAPVERLVLIMQQCGITHLISADAKTATLEALCERLPKLSCIVGVTTDIAPTVRCISWDIVTTTPPAAPVRMISSDIAYIIFTSGSTGMPKGVTHTHASGLHYARGITDLFGILPSDRLANHAPLHFDISLFDFLGGPLCGATTVILPDPYKAFPASMSELMEKEKVSIWFSAPFALTELCLRGVLDQRDLTALRWVIFGGEPFAPKYLNALIAQWPHARFSNCYGPAEVNACTYHHIDQPLADDVEAIPIGRIWDVAEGLIVDENDAPVAFGTPGELLVRTPTMMRGYWRAPDLNATCFYHRLVTEDFSDRFYRTGDLVVDGGPDGMQFLGRKDRQIKLRGFRIELDEIEAVLAQHAQVEEAGSFLSADASTIWAAVTLQPGAMTTPEELIVHCRDRLARYCVPAEIHILQEFPRTSSKKIDRRALAMLFDPNT